MKQLLLLYLIIFNISNSWAQNKFLCITVDDLPTISYGPRNPALEKEITQKLTRTFTKFNIPAIGYVNEIQLYRNGKLDSSKIELLRMWLQGGNDLGNHTFSHLDFNKVSDSVYFEDILKGEQVTRMLMKENGKNLRYFRHPYLHTGMDESRHKALNNYLDSLHYITSPVTIDNSDYIFAKFYSQAYAQKNDSLMKKIGKSYLDYMEQKLLYFEQKTSEVFGRNITQTLLLHANLLNADYMDKLAIMYKKHGYTFVSQTQALKDKAYESLDTYYRPYGVSWIFRWGISKGMNSNLTSGDIEVPVYIINMKEE